MAMELATRPSQKQPNPKTRTKPGLQGADYTEILAKVVSGQRTSVIDSAPFFVDAFKKWRRQCVDIEVEFESEDASAENPENPITLISIKDNFSPDKAWFFTFREDFVKHKSSFQYYEEHTKRTFDIVIFWYAEERELLADFFYFIKKTRADMLYGWYFEDFDVPYIINRAHLLAVDEVFLMSPDGTVYSQKNIAKAAGEKEFNRHNFRNVVSGTTLFDMKWGYTRIQGLFPEGNGLNQVSLRHNGFGKKTTSITEESWYRDPVPVKENSDGEMVEDFKEEGFFKFIIYGFYDVLEPELIEDKTYTLFTFFFITRFTSIEWEKLHHFSVAIDMAQLMYKDTSLFLPSKRLNIEIEDYEIEGGHVENPPIGMIAWYMIVLDASRQYPNMIRDANLGVDTYIDPKDHDQWEDKDIVKLSNGDWFRKDVVSFLSDIVSKIFSLRDFIDKQIDEYEPLDPMYEIWQKIKTVVKNLINAIYGANGNPHTRMFHLPTARSITLLGRELLDHDKKYTKIIAKNLKQGIKYDNKYADGDNVLEDGTILKSNLEKRYGDSITGNRCIAIKKNGMIDVVPIEELWEMDDSVTFNRNDKEIKNPSNLLTINKDGKWEKVNEIIRHKSRKKIYRINQKNGETECTEDHSVITEGFVETKPQEIGNKRILYLKKINIEEIKSGEMIDLYPLLKDFSFLIEFRGEKRLYSWHIDETSTLLGDKTDTIYFGRKELKKTVSIKRFVKKETLCKLLGIFASEGHVSIKNDPFGYCAGISNANKDLIDEISDLAKEINYDAEISTLVTEDGMRNVQGYEYYSKCYRVQMNNLTWGAFFQFLCGKGSSGKKVPSFVFNIEKKYQRMFYDYYFKGDGSNAKNNTGFTREFTSISLRLVSGLSFLLKNLGIDVSIHVDRRKNAYGVRERKIGESPNAKTINRITDEGCEEKFVYDLALSTSHIFADACGMILLHNTDSIMSHPSITDLNKVVAIGHLYSYFMNKSLKIFCKERNMFGKYLKLEFESVYMNMFFPEKAGEERGTKKQYCLYEVWKNVKEINKRFIVPPKFKMMGMAGKKSNTPLFSKDLQINFLKNACKGLPNDQLSDYVVKIIKECKSYLRKTTCYNCGSNTMKKNEKIDPAEPDTYTCSKCGCFLSKHDLTYDPKLLMKIGTPYRFGKAADQYTPSQIAYKIAESIQSIFKKRVRKAETYLYFWLTGNRRGNNVFAMNPESPKVPRGIDIDVKTTIEKLVHDKLKTILPLFNIEWADVRNADTSISLSKFFLKGDK